VTDAGAEAAFGAVRRRVSPGLALAFKMAGGGAVEASADGVRVRLSDGRELIDFGSYAVTLLGHRHPLVIAAVARQLETMPTSTRALANPATAAFADELADLCGPPLERVWLGSDGADAVEVATKLARRRTGRSRLLAVRGGFHGKTLGALALTSHPMFRQGLAPVLVHVTHLDPTDAGAAAAELEAGDVAALVFEPIRGENGVRPLDPAVARRWSEDAHAAGAYVIADEVQVGLRRCGPVSVARSQDLAPDALLLGKALGGGVAPLAAAVLTEDLHGPLASDPTWHTATFGGHPLACAAGRAALQAIEAHAADAERLALSFEAALRDLVASHAGLVSDVRGAGLLWAVELESPGLAGMLLTELAQRGLLVSPCLSDVRSIRFAPPMVTAMGDLDEAVAILTESLAATAAAADGLG
jgi:putrescine aminotransferase